MTNHTNSDGTGCREESEAAAESKSPVEAAVREDTKLSDEVATREEGAVVASESSGEADGGMDVGSPQKRAVVPEELCTSEKTETTSPKSEGETIPETVDFKVIYNKKKFDVSLPLETDVGGLKAHLQPLIEIPPAMMKVMIKGLAKDEMTLRRLGVSKGSKIMVVGSSLTDVLQVSTQPKFVPSTSGGNSSAGESTSSSETCKQQQHKKVLDRGKPEDAMVAILNSQEPLPPHPLSGMLNKAGGKVRLTFKLELDQLWIGTKERTEKVPLSTIKNVLSEAIEGHPGYHILAIQRGPTEASRYFIYWVPAQYVQSIKDAILGKWPSL